MTNEKPTVATPSPQWLAMSPDWKRIGDIRAGLDAVRASGREYLPKFEDESEAEYTRRLAAAPWRAEFVDALRTLTAKPFTKDIAIANEPSEAVKAVYEDADQRGNNLTVVARHLFVDAVAEGWAAVLVDYPMTEAVRTRAEERAAGARPYLVPIKASDIIALFTKVVNGVETVEHIRIRETVIERDGYGEAAINRIRVLEPGRWEVHREYAGLGGKTEWRLEAEGALMRAGRPASVPIAFLRCGDMDGPIRVKPPLADLAHMQVELFRAMSREDEVMTYTASPMLKVIGLAQPDSPLVTGPRRAIYVPPGEGNTDVDYLVPPAANIEQIRAKVSSIIEDMRRAGMQPMLQKANVSVAGTVTDAAKAHSVLQAWTIALKDCLEQAFVFVAEYINEPQTVEFNVHTDFAAGVGGDTELQTLDKARARGDVSRLTFWEELSRRGVLGPQFDATAEDERLAEEGEPLEPEIELAATGIGSGDTRADAPRTT